MVSGRVPIVREEQNRGDNRHAPPPQQQHENIIPTPPHRYDSHLAARQEQANDESNLPSWQAMHNIAQTYLTYCDSQPLPLFHRKSFQQTIRTRDQELLLAILALTLRFTDEVAVRGLSKHEQVAGYVEGCRKIVSGKVFEGSVELSTIQCLCLLSLVDFTSTSCTT